MAHFDRNNIIAPYLLYYLESLKRISSDIVFVSTAALSNNEQLKIKSLVSKIILKENRGYDFGSWQIGLKQIDLFKYDEIIIANDSVFGPLFSLEMPFNEMTSSNCDFWGITNSFDLGEHIQSYFVVFKSKVFQSKAFQDFWQSIEIQSNKFDIIQKYEVGLTQTLLKAGFKYKVLIPCRYFWGFMNLYKFIAQKMNLKLFFQKFKNNSIHSPMNLSFKNLIYQWVTLKANPTHRYWIQTIKNRSPFIKIELLRDNPLNENISNWENVIKEQSRYPIWLIKEYLRFNKSSKVGNNIQ